MINKVLRTIEEYNMIKPGDAVIVALSGGPDSSCLLHILYSLKDELGIQLYAAHVNHCLRGEEADEDEQYVKDVCEKFDVKLFVKRVDVKKIANEKGISSELAGREARYDFFEELITELNADKVALAHNANDQAETVLMRFMRGTGLRGLMGIRGIRDGVYIRPILKVMRSEIELYCNTMKLNPRIDKTNYERIYSRNKIRLDLIPYIKENFNENIINTVTRFSDTISVDENYLEKIAYNNFKEYCKNKKNKVIINKEAFFLDEAILTRVIRLAIEAVVGNLNNFEKNNIYDLIDLQKNSTGKKIYMPSQLVAYNNYGKIELAKKDCFQKDTILDEKEFYRLELNKTNIIDELGMRVTIKVCENGKENYENKKLIKSFNFDNINSDIILRYRKNGDKFCPLGMSGRKKLKDFFIDLKIPKEERNSIPLICFDDEIAWIVGYRSSEKYKIINTTKQILKIIIEREDSFNEK